MPSKTVSVTSGKWNRVKEAFVGRHPIPTDPATNEPICNENEWPFVYLKKLVARTVRAHEKEHQGDSAPAMDEDIMTVF